jgi:hypothetical protein
MKPLNKLAVAQLIVDREKARKDKLTRRRATRLVVKSLRTMADMLESGEVSEWSLETNFGHMPLYGDSRVPIALRGNGQDDLSIKFRYSLAMFAKRLRRRKAR